MPPDQPPAAPAPSKGDRTRQALLRAAVVRFARDGYRGTSVADVCRDAGLSTTASYPYFANKEAFFVAAVDEDVAGLIGDAVSFVAIDENLEGWGGVMIQALLDHIPHHPLAASTSWRTLPDSCSLRMSSVTVLRSSCRAGM